MSRLTPKIATILAATAAAGISGAAIAGATNTSPSTSTTPSAAPQQRPARPAETALTGETKQKVEAAALAKVPGTVIRTETDENGVYESHIRKSDGTEVEVSVDKNFNVTSVETRPADGPGGPGGMGGPGGPGGFGHHGMPVDLAAVAKDLGVSEAKLQSALQSARPTNGGPPDGGESQEHAAMDAAVAKALGLDAAQVRKAFEAHRPAPPTQQNPSQP